MSSTYPTTPAEHPVTQLAGDGDRNFTYSKINSEYKQIRLLCIIQDPKGNTLAEEARQGIKCTIETASLLHAPCFYALSYRWDSSPADANIVIDDSDFTVGNNLYLALQRLRDYLPTDEERSAELGITISRAIWIDAISINQNDPDEKGWQVAQMGEIYTKASRTVAWLGPAFNGSETAFARLGEVGQSAIDKGFSFERHWPSWFEQLEEKTEEFAEDRLPKEQSSLESYFWNFTRDHILDRTSSHAKNSSITKPVEKTEPGALEHILELLSVEWWSRVWVIQEVTLAQELDFLCGEHEISWELLNTSLLFFSTAERIQSRLFDLGLDRVAEIRGKAFLDQLEHQLENRSTPQRNLLRIMRFDRKLDLVTEGVDLLSMKPCQEYAPTNLDIRRRYLLRNDINSGNYLSTWLYKVAVQQPPQKASDHRDLIYALSGLVPAASRIYPDYHRTVEWVFTEAAKVCIEQGHVGILSLCQWPRRYDALPTWVPDWSQPLRVPIEEIHSSPFRDKAITFHDGGRTVCMQGRPLLTVSHVIRVEEQANPEDLDAAFIVKLDHDYRSTLETLDLPLPEHERHGRLIRFLLTSLRWPQSQPPQTLATRKSSSTPPFLPHESPLTLDGTLETTNPTSLSNYLAKILRNERIEDFQTWMMEVRAIKATYKTTPKFSPAFGKLALKTVVTWARMAKGRVDLITKDLRPMRRVVTRAALIAACERTLEGRMVLVGRDGSLGLCPLHTETGDVVVRFEGVKSSYVLRRMGEARYHLIGEGFWEQDTQGSDQKEGNMEQFFIE